MHTLLRCPCAPVGINICVHVKDTKVHVRVRGIMETLKHPACAVGWVERLCRGWLSSGKATRICLCTWPATYFAIINLAPTIAPLHHGKTAGSGEGCLNVIRQIEAR